MRDGVSGGCVTSHCLLEAAKAGPRAQHLGRFRGMLAVLRNCHMCNRIKDGYHGFAQVTVLRNSKCFGKPSPVLRPLCFVFRTWDSFAQHLGRFRGMLAVPRNCHMCNSSQMLCPSHVQFIPVCFARHMCNSSLCALTVTCAKGWVLRLCTGDSSPKQQVFRETVPSALCCGKPSPVLRPRCCGEFSEIMYLYH